MSLHDDRLPRFPAITHQCIPNPRPAAREAVKADSANQRVPLHSSEITAMRAAVNVGRYVSISSRVVARVVRRTGSQGRMSWLTSRWG